MIPFSGRIEQCLKWMQNKAPHVQSLISAKSLWYTRYDQDFWDDWKVNVFDIKTANPFGLAIWCIILGLPAKNLGLEQGSEAWAYGKFRQNYIYSGTDPDLQNPNLIGGNFVGGGDTSIRDLDEIRKLLQLRYVSIVSNGRLAFVNEMLAAIFNDGKPWDFSTGKYFYVTDCTMKPSALRSLTMDFVSDSYYFEPDTEVDSSSGQSPIVGAFKIEYRIGKGLTFSDQFINLLNEPNSLILPSFGGSSLKVIKETA